MVTAPRGLQGVYICKTDEGLMHEGMFQLYDIVSINNSDGINEIYKPVLRRDYASKYCMGLKNMGGLGNRVIESFIRSTNNCYMYSERIINIDRALAGYIPIMWGILRGNSRIIWNMIDSGRRWIYIDHAYLRRGHESGNYRVTLSGYSQNRLCNRNANRLVKLGIKTDRWRNQGSHILVCPPTYNYKVHHRINQWTQMTIGELQKYTDRPIRVREKPKGGKELNLRDDLVDCHCVVTHGSNAAVEAIIWGVPSIVDETHAAASISSVSVKDIENPKMGDRDLWLNTLSYNQFTLDEIESGIALDILIENQELYID